MRRLEKSACAHNDGGGGDNSGGGGGDSDGHAQCVCVVLAGARGAKGVCEAHARASCAQCARKRVAQRTMQTLVLPVCCLTPHTITARRRWAVPGGLAADEAQLRALRLLSSRTALGSRLRPSMAQKSEEAGADLPSFCEHLSPQRPNGQGFCVHIGEKDSGHGVSSHSAAASSANLASSASSRDLRSS